MAVAGDVCRGLLDGGLFGNRLGFSNFFVFGQTMQTPSWKQRTAGRWSKINTDDPAKDHEDTG